MYQSLDSPNAAIDGTREPVVNGKGHHNRCKWWWILLKFPVEGGEKNATLHPVSNHFRDERIEESYQLYRTQHDFFRAQCILWFVMISHMVSTFMFGFIDKESFGGLHVIDFYGSGVKIWIQYMYTIIAVPFSVVCLSWLDQFGPCRLAVYILRKRWKRWVAVIIVAFTIGLQIWATLNANDTLEAFVRHIEPAVHCADSIPEQNENIWLQYYMEGTTSTIDFMTKRNVLLYEQFTLIMAVLFTVIGSTIAISIRLDFLQGLLTVTASCMALSIILLLDRDGLIDETHHLLKTKWMSILMFLTVVIPNGLILIAMYSSDRRSRDAYITRVRVERANTALKSNLTHTRDQLSNKGVTDSERQAVHYAFMASKNDLLDAISIPFDDLSLIRTIGRGSSGDVLLGEYLGASVAIKRLAKPLLSRQYLQRVKEQVEMLACLRHPNIVQFIGVSWDSIANVCIVSEHMERGDVYSLLHSAHVNMTWNDPLLKIATDAAQGLCYLHHSEPPILHRDFKSTNLLVSATYGCKISDFGESRRQFEDRMTTIVGTPYWLAPEILREECYGAKADCYSFGIVLVELETRQDPYYDVDWNVFEIMMHIATGKLVPTLPSSCLPARYQLIRDCLEYDPTRRPSMAEILTRLQGCVMQELVAQDSKHGVGLQRRKLLRRQEFKSNLN